MGASMDPVFTLYLGNLFGGEWLIFEVRLGVPFPSTDFALHRRLSHQSSGLTLHGCCFVELVRGGGACVGHKWRCFRGRPHM